jgi:hypothetical protein
MQLIPVDLESNAGRKRLPQLAFRALDFDDPGLRIDLHALRNRNWLLTDS